MNKGLRTTTLLVCLLAIVLVMSSGCVGSFKRTSNLLKWNNSLEKKWTREGVFVGFIILPVYPMVMLSDAVIFNSMEFWTGSSPSTVEVETPRAKGPELARIEGQDEGFDSRLETPR